LDSSFINRLDKQKIIIFFCFFVVQGPAESRAALQEFIEVISSKFRTMIQALNDILKVLGPTRELLRSAITGPIQKKIILQPANQNGKLSIF
jgi:hypothetical protein